MSDLKPLYEKLSPILRDQARYEYTDELAGAVIDAIVPEIEAPFLARIAELEKREKHLEEMFHGWRDEARKADARISKLEAALKDLREAAYDVDEMDMPFSQRNE